MSAFRKRPLVLIFKWICTSNRRNSREIIYRYRLAVPCRHSLNRQRRPLLLLLAVAQQPVGHSRLDSTKRSRQEVGFAAETQAAERRAGVVAAAAAAVAELLGPRRREEGLDWKEVRAG